MKKLEFMGIKKGQDLDILVDDKIIYKLVIDKKGVPVIYKMGVKSDKT